MNETNHHPLEQFHFCPKCGSSQFTVHDEKSKRCACCGFVYYFNPSAATVAIIRNERGELLVCRRAKEPARGTLDLSGGFIDCHETAEEGVAREVLEETGLEVVESRYLFSLPNIYPFSGFEVHTEDLFFLCTVRDTGHLKAMDDVAAAGWMRPESIRPEAFGLGSVRKGIERYLKELNTESGELNS